MPSRRALISASVKTSSLLLATFSHDFLSWSSKQKPQMSHRHATLSIPGMFIVTQKREHSPAMTLQAAIGWKQPEKYEVMDEKILLKKPGLSSFEA